MKQIIHGFTLIELLIVVAIIAILAAIAVPNFLEAQTRAKISRNMADMRTIATGLESYYVDNNHYPSGLRPNSTAFKNYLPRLTPLTTPIAYLTLIPNDVFNTFGESEPREEFKTFDYVQRHEIGGIWTLEFHNIQGNPIECKYMMRGWGPDQDNDRASGWSLMAGPIPYDPTNGTISNGDIKYFGPGVGFGL